MLDYETLSRLTNKAKTFSPIGFTLSTWLEISHGFTVYLSFCIKQRWTGKRRSKIDRVLQKMEANRTQPWSPVLGSSKQSVQFAGEKGIVVNFI